MAKTTKRKLNESEGINSSEFMAAFLTAKEECKNITQVDIHYEFGEFGDYSEGIAVFLSNEDMTKNPMIYATVGIEDGKLTFSYEDAESDEYFMGVELEDSQAKEVLEFLGSVTEKRFLNPNAEVNTNELYSEVLENVEIYDWSSGKLVEFGPPTSKGLDLTKKPEELNEEEAETDYEEYFDFLGYKLTQELDDYVKNIEVDNVKKGDGNYYDIWWSADDKNDNEVKGKTTVKMRLIDNGEVEDFDIVRNKKLNESKKPSKTGLSESFIQSASRFV